MAIKRKTIQEFIDQIEGLHPGKYEIIGEYIGAQEPIETIYKECGHKGFPLAHSLYKGCRCGICHGPKLQSHEQFVNKIERLYPGKYTILGTYTKSSERIEVKYNSCGHVGNPKAAYLRQGAGCPICNRGEKFTQEEFYEKFYEAAGDEYEPLDEYVNTKQSMKIRHKTCGQVFNRHLGVLLQDGCRCPKCYPESARSLIVGLNDIHSTNPELESLLKYPEAAYKHTQYSRDKEWFVCPHCGHEIEKKIIYVTTNGLCCPECNINYSYGERFVANLLSAKGIDYKFQYSPKWIRPYAYDFMFKLNGRKYIVEVDGQWHFIDNDLSQTLVSEAIDRDKYKQEMAEQNEFVVVRLNYNYKSNDEKVMYIINSIENSILKEVLDLYDFDYSEIIMKTSIPIVKIVADLWNSYDLKLASKIQNELKLGSNSVRKMLYLASHLGLIPETKEEIIYINKSNCRKAYGLSNYTKVMCNETGEIFQTMKDADKKYHAHLSVYFSDDNRKYSGTLPDGTRLTWAKLVS